MQQLQATRGEPVVLMRVENQVKTWNSLIDPARGQELAGVDAGGSSPTEHIALERDLVQGQMLRPIPWIRSLMGLASRSLPWRSSWTSGFAAVADRVVD